MYRTADAIRRFMEVKNVTIAPCQLVTMSPFQPFTLSISMLALNGCLLSPEP
jgi:hypothetical protein